MTSYLGVHFIAEVHAGQHHMDYIRQVNPRIMKTVAGSMPDVQVLANVNAAAPNAIHYWRNHALSEQHSDLWSNPGKTGNRHAEELHAQIEQRYAEAAQRGLRLPDRAQVRVLGVNEPVVELFARKEDGSNYDEWLAMMRHRTPLLDEYMMAFGTRANALGWGAGLGNFSSGQPANLKPGGYPTFVTWFPRTAAMLEQTRGRNALAVHEYFTAVQGPQGWWDWHTYRFKHYEVDCDIDVLECGVDHGIIGERLSGWQGRISAQNYAAHLETYIRRCMTDSRFRGATPFTLDGAREWQSFYIEPAMPELASLAKRLPVTSQSHTVHIPAVIAPQLQPPVAQPSVKQTLDTRVMEAIIAVESGRRTHGSDGRLIVRVEAHLLLSATYGKPDLFEPYFSFTPNNILDAYYRQTPQGPWIAYHGDQRREHEALALARWLHNETALRCTSMGAGQVMGFHAVRVGFRTAQDMYDVLASSQSAHYVAMCNYMLSDPALHAAINARDWPEIGRRYNGAASAGELYKAAYVRLWGG